MTSKALVGAATRYIAGRNAVQTVYWRSKDSTTDPKMFKVSKTFRILDKAATPPKHIQHRSIYYLH